MRTDDAENTNEDVAAERVGDHILGLHVELVLVPVPCSLVSELS